MRNSFLEGILERWALTDVGPSLIDSSIPWHVLWLNSWPMYDIYSGQTLLMLACLEHDHSPRFLVAIPDLPLGPLHQCTSILEWTLDSLWKWGWCEVQGDYGYIWGDQQHSGNPAVIAKDLGSMKLSVGLFQHAQVLIRIANVDMEVTKWQIGPVLSAVLVTIGRVQPREFVNSRNHAFGRDTLHPSKPCSAEAFCRRKIEPIAYHVHISHLARVSWYWGTIKSTRGSKHYQRNKTTLLNPALECLLDIIAAQPLIIKMCLYGKHRFNPPVFYNLALLSVHMSLYHEQTELCNVSPWKPPLLPWQNLWTSIMPSDEYVNQGEMTQFSQFTSCQCQQCKSYIWASRLHFHLLALTPPYMIQRISLINVVIMIKGRNTLGTQTMLCHTFLSNGNFSGMSIMQEVYRWFFTISLQRTLHSCKWILQMTLIHAFNCICIIDSCSKLFDP